MERPIALSVGFADSLELVSVSPMKVRQILARTPALTGIESEALARLAVKAEERELERGQYLWHAGEQPQHLTVIRNGLVKVVKVGQSGKRAICGLFGAPDTIGDAALWRQIAYPADAIVVTTSASVVEVPKDALDAEIARNPRLSMSCANAVQHKLSTLLEKIDVLSAGAVEARLATVLLNLYERFGDERDDNTRFIPVVLSRQELADLVSTSFETAIRAMTRWEREGIVETNGQGFVLHNWQQLVAASGRASSEESSH